MRFISDSIMRICSKFNVVTLPIPSWHPLSVNDFRVVCPQQGRENRPPHPPAGGAPAMSKGPASVAILLLFYFFNFENYNFYFHDQLAGTGGGHQLNHPRHFVLYQGLL